MILKIANGTEIDIETGDLVEVVDSFKQKELDGNLLVIRVTETTVIVESKKNGKPQVISPTIIKEITKVNKVKRADVVEVLKDVAPDVIEKEVKKVLKQSLPELMTQKFIDDIAKDALKSMVRNELGLALRQAANLIDPPKGK